MIDAELMKSINAQIDAADVEQARAALQMGIVVMPSANVQRGKPMLMVHPDTYERLRKEFHG